MVGFPHVTPQVLIIFSRKTPWVCWGNSPFSDTSVYRGWKHTSYSFISGHLEFIRGITHNPIYNDRRGPILWDSRINHHHPLTMLAISWQKRDIESPQISDKKKFHPRPWRQRSFANQVALPIPCKRQGLLQLIWVDFDVLDASVIQ